MDIHTMRLAVSRAYNGQKWKDRVRDMSDEQVMAIYHKMLGSGQVKKNRGPVYKQLSY